jgi:hypothetical protein
MTQDPAHYRDLETSVPTFNEDSFDDREAWAAWRQLLTAAQPEFEAAVGNPAKLAERVAQELIRRRKTRRRLSLAAAAVLLLGAAATWFAAGRPSTAVTTSRSTAELADAADWDNDALDVELALTLHHAEAIESQWRQPADALAYVRRQMDALEAEFDGNSL